MVIEYLQIQPESELPTLSAFSPFRAVVVIDELVTIEWQILVSSWLVKSGCLYMMAWGKECSTWDDFVDFEHLEVFNFEEIPADKFLYTSWHEGESLREVFWFAKNCALHPIFIMQNTLILHISSKNKMTELLLEYARA